VKRAIDSAHGGEDKQRSRAEDARETPAALAAGGGCWFRAGAQELHVGVEEPFAPARKAHPGLVADDLGALAGRLRDGGHEVAFDNAIPGAKRFHVADSFGNRLEIRQG